MSHCAPGFYNPKQKFHWLYHCCSAVIYKTGQHQLNKTSVIWLPKFTIIRMAVQVLVKKNSFFGITILEDGFLADSELSDTFGFGWKCLGYIVM